jgi:hypothetical protein
LNKKIKFIPIVLFLSALVILVSCQQKNTKWKGTIEEEDGVKVVKNPDEPLYGEIQLDLEEDLSIGREDDENYMFYSARNIALDSDENIYVLDSGNHRIQKFDKDGRFLQTIGKKGQGPGEFENPGDFFLDEQDSIYVLDSRKIKVFNEETDFMKEIILQNPLYDFFIDTNGDIIGLANIRRNNENKQAVVRMDASGKIVKNLAEFSDVKPTVRKEREVQFRFVVYHSYSPRLCLSRMNSQNFSFAYPLEYRINVMDTNYKIFLTIHKEEKSHLITQKEKEVIIEGIEEYVSRRGQKWPKDVLEEACDFPSIRPFFRWMGSDDKKRLYVWRMKSVVVESQERQFDLFSREGYYLYLIKSPVLPYIIKKGFLYDIKENEDTGEIFIRRFRIKNWDQIKEGA